MMRVTGAALSHAGQIRKTNQDRALYTPLVGAVADGMGGHQGGEQAAAIAIDVFGRVDEPLTKDGLVDTVRAANQAVFDESERPELRGMGTTIVAAVLHPEERRLTIANVGDSRAYRLRDGELEQVTVDHSLVEELVRQGRISEEDAQSHPQRNIVTRALGLTADLDVDVFDLDARHGDRVLLCSDGLSNEVGVDEIADRLRSVDDPERAAEELIALAVAGGGRDNISVVLLDVVDDADPAAVRAAAESTPRPTPKAAAKVFDTAVIDEVELDTDDAGPDLDDRQRTEEYPPVDPAVSDDVYEVDRDLPDPVLLDPARMQAVDRDRSRTRWVGLAVIATCLVAFLGINWFASSAYFAAADSGEVVIFRGRPGGILWIDPDVEERTGVEVDELAPAGVQKLQQELEWTTLEDAVRFVEQLERVDTADPESNEFED